MLRDRVLEGRVSDKPWWRWRGREVARIEALSDAVFGFAITLLVISLEVPRTFDQLMVAMRGMAAFAASFAVLFLVWLNQYRFFRRYGMADGATMWLNAILLFVILFFVYPLKFVFGFVIGMAMGDPLLVTLADGTQAPKLGPGDAQRMMLVYNLGYMAVFAIFALLHLHAYRRRAELELNELEAYDTVDNVRETLLNVAIGALSITLAYLGGRAGPMWGGLVYWLVGPTLAINAVFSRRARKALIARAEAAAAAAAPSGTRARPAVGAG
jgi:hypothetical protein